MQSNLNKWMLLLLATVLIGAVSCTSDSLDDGDSADVVLEISVFDAPAVSASLDQMTLVCTFTINDWQVSFENLPKNGSADDSSPFNDIVVQDVAITYNWIDPANATPSRTFGLGGVAVPVGEQIQATFTPIAFDDLTLAISGSTANLQMVFRAVTVEGTQMFIGVTKQLNIEGCI
ncbi:MAG: hypothetical protein OEV00_08970 [Acidobacteriota bacterium]|nr:hypothetical protein [Acidobacteriota bacterium]MDH3785442.1 hypothetical protein [Acidobacteriota bacterium]